MEIHTPTDYRPALASVALAALLALGLGVLSASASADADAKAASKSTPAPDLNRVIALGATRPETSAFADAWTQWVRANPDADIDKTIETVASRAMSMASMSAIARDPTSPAQRPSRERLVDHMQQLATSAVRSTRYLH